MTVLFHASERLLAPETRLAPCKWRDTVEYGVVRSAVLAGDNQLSALLYADWLTNAKFNASWKTPVWIREAICENIRVASFADVASRLDAKYCFEDIQAAEKYVATRKKGKGLIYECRATGDTDLYRFDMVWWERMNFDLTSSLEPQFREASRLAQAYFLGSASDDPHWEILTVGEVEVVKLSIVVQDGIAVSR